MAKKHIVMSADFPVLTALFNSLSAEFDQAVRYVSRDVVNKARRHGIHDDVLSASHADRRQLE